MSKDGSVAPKERVNIRYQPSTGGEDGETELPNRMMCVGDYSGRESGTPVEDRKPVPVDTSNFDAVLAGQNLSLDLDVPDKLSGEPDTLLGVSVEFRSLKDFGPDALVRNVPELQKLMALRDGLAALRGPLGRRDFKKRLEELLATKAGALLEELADEAAGKLE